MENKDIYNLLAPYSTERRQRLIDEVSDARTNYVTVVLEKLTHEHNMSAIIRTCDCFGLNDIHVIEKSQQYAVNPKIVKGSDKWINIVRYEEEKNGDNTVSAIKNLKAQGYRIIATTPHENDVNLHDLDLAKGKMAFVFGSEKDGISEKVKEMADEFVKIPMCGFTESLNVSVAAGITIHYITHMLRRSSIDWRMTADELDELRLKWMRSSVRSADDIEKRLLEGK